MVQPHSTINSTWECISHGADKLHSLWSFRLTPILAIVFRHDLVQGQHNSSTLAIPLWSPASRAFSSAAVVRTAVENEEGTRQGAIPWGDGTLGFPALRLLRLVFRPRGARRCPSINFKLRGGGRARLPLSNRSRTCTDRYVDKGRLRYTDCFFIRVGGCDRLAVSSLLQGFPYLSFPPPAFSPQRESTSSSVA